MNGTLQAYIEGQQPLTHEAYRAICAARASAGRSALGLHVQIRVKGETLCGTVHTVHDQMPATHRQWFTVETAAGHFFVESRNVRVLSVAHCYCSAQAGGTQ